MFGCTSNNDHQTPPQGHAAVESWLALGFYKAWAAEPAIHASRMPSPHGFDRVFSNDVLAAAATQTGAWPKGSASVKELYMSATDATPIGYAVYLKLAADSAAGANWYWYERIPPNTPGVPTDANGVVADGTGGGGAAMSICVGCHAGAGMDAMHTPTPGGRDFVYTPVP
jgi:hypothetical protein